MNLAYCIPSSSSSWLAPYLGARDFVYCVHRTHTFANRNMVVEPEIPRGRVRTVTIVLASRNSIGEDLLELGLLADALSRRQNQPIGCLVSYLQYSRSNRPNDRSGALGARVYADFLCSTAIDHFEVFDLHSSDVVGFFRKPIRQHRTVDLFVQAVQATGPVDFVVAPDRGRYDDCIELAARLKARPEVLLKVRQGHSAAEFPEYQGKAHLRDRSVLLFDDEITSGTTMLSAIKILSEVGARSIQVGAVYSFCGSELLERLGAAERVVSFMTTNLVPVEWPERSRLRPRVLDAFSLVSP